MKPNRQILVTAFLTIALFSIVAYSACKKDPCDKVICLHLGACDGGNCVCPTGYEGLRCEVLSRDKFVFTFNGGDTCHKVDTVYTQYPIYLRANIYDPLELTMKNFLNNMDDSAVCVMRATDSFSFQGSNNSVTYHGTAKMRNDSLWMVYHVDADTTSYDCKYFGQGLR
jgi:hypothetical protein